MREQLYRLLEEHLDDLEDLGTPDQLKEYLEEEIEEFEFVGWDSLKNRSVTDANPYNILSYYLLGKAPKPSRLRHYWETGDFPDIDADIDPRYRDQVKQYIAQRWGENACLEVATYGGVHVKSAIQDLGRVFNLNPSDVARVTTTIKMDPNDASQNTLEAIVEKNPTVRQFLNAHPEIYENVEKMQEVKRSIGKHASAYVISNKNLFETVPVVLGKNKEPLIAYPESSGTKALNSLGFIKFDLLGLEHVGVIADTLKLIKERHGIDIDWNKIDVEDEAVYKAFCLGYNAGVFQFNTSTAERVISVVQPERFLDLVAINALIRPAALDSNAHTYYRLHKNGKYKPSEYPVWKELKGKVSDFTYNLLDMTYGIMAFQEQLMALISDFCAVDFDETNKARKILATPSHKRSKDVEKYILELQGKWLENGKKMLGEKKAWQWWNVTVGALKYAFNLSHSLAYTTIGFREMWLKLNYPNEFYEAVINHIPSDIMVFIDEAARLGVQVEAPSVNTSSLNISTIEGKIYLGLAHCKYVGYGPAQQILEKRPYTSFEDFVEKHTFKGTAVNKRVIESLIYANAFREFGDRDEIWEQWKRLRKIKGETPDFISEEYDVLGIVISEQRALDTPYGCLTPSKALRIPEGQMIELYGVVDNISYKTSKSGNPYARVELTDYKHSVTLFIWKNRLNFAKAMSKGDKVHVKAKSMGDGSFSLVTVR